MNNSAGTYRLFCLSTALLLGMPCLFANAASTNALAPAGKFDSKKPIEISSNSLEVQQHENQAIFKGNVIAVQDQVRMKSDVMVVHYKQQGGGQGSAAPKPVAPQPVSAAPGVAGAMGAITRIDVEGHVFVATPEESAKGDKGNYDVDSHTIHLFGPDVVLTRDKNILKGTALEYNLETGRSLLTSGGSTQAQGGGRVRSVFVPNQEKKP